jgi:hypothetical protein
MTTIERRGRIDQPLTSASAAVSPGIISSVADVRRDRPQRSAMRGFESFAELLGALGRQVAAVRAGRRWRGRAR